ncbi:5130_t:CDS:2, partial [Acaulospora colombiana]
MRLEELSSQAWTQPDPYLEQSYNQQFLVRFFFDDICGVMLTNNVKIYFRKEREADSIMEGTHLITVSDESSEYRATVLSLPIGQNIALQDRVQRFTNALLAADPPIEGLDETIIIEPARLHITLGLLHLEKSNDTNAADQEDTKTVQQALDLLNSLRSEVVRIVKGTEVSEPGGNGANETGGIPVNLDTMGTLKKDKNDTAHILWIGPEPSSGPDQTILERVATIVHDTFKEEGFIADNRSLKPYKALDPATQDSPAPSSQSPTSQRPNFGTCFVDEIQLCAASPIDPETGTYTVVGSIK